MLRFLRLVDHGVLEDTIENVEAQVVWLPDNESVLYIEKDPQTLLGLRVRRHVLGTPASDDVLVHEEDDESFYTWIDTSKDERYVLIGSIEHRHERAALRTGRRSGRFDSKSSCRASATTSTRPSRSASAGSSGRTAARPTSAWSRPASTRVRDPGTWRELIAHREDASIVGFDVFDSFIAVEERSGGLRRLRLRDWDGGNERYIESDEPAFHMALGANEETDSRLVRYVYTSLTTPRRPTTSTWTRAVRRCSSASRCSAISIRRTTSPSTSGQPARDGEQVPVALVYRRGVRRDGTAPLLQYGYGAYGLSSDPYFSSRRLSLLDRGFVFAIAQVRGGQELGRRWYDHGRLLAKRNSFDDFIDVTRWLVAQRLRGSVARRGDRWQRGRAARRRRGQPRAAGLPRDRRARSVRRRRDDDARQQHPAHDERVRRVGRPARAALLRLHALVLAVRQRAAAGLPRDAGHAPGSGTARCSTSSRPSGSRDCGASRPTTVRSTFASRWKPDTADAPAASGSSTRSAEDYAFILDQVGLAGSVERLMSERTAVRD